MAQFHVHQNKTEKRHHVEKLKRNKVQKFSNWNPVSGKENLNSILKKSEDKPQVIYKHSNRCSISYLSKEDLEENMDVLSNHVDLHFVDVIEQRDLSNDVAENFNVRHESPQVILLKDGHVLWNGSHWDVKGENILSELG